MGMVCLNNYNLKDVFFADQLGEDPGGEQRSLLALRDGVSLGFLLIQRRNHQVPGGTAQTVRQGQRTGTCSSLRPSQDLLLPHRPA